jgi:hypothetical protein
VSDDSLGFEPIDDELRRRLGAVGPQPGDPDAVLGALRPRYRRAKRRHQMVAAGASALAIVAIVGVGAVALTSGGSGSRNVRVPAANSSVPSRETTTTAPVNPAPTTPPQPSGDTGATGGGTAGSGSGSGVAPTATVAPSASSTKTYSSAGGSVTVKLENGALSIVSTKAASGYTEARHDTGPDRVEVRFTNATTEWRIRVDLVNGEMVEETTQH